MTTHRNFNPRLSPIETSLPAVLRTSQGEEERAAACAARHAISWDDCLDLLDALGLRTEELERVARDRRDHPPAHDTTKDSAV
ncbi:hypothetical protein [Streptomyces sp. NPDC091278]|uniref:hypothetical protein n=1 Tax=Streptomyces sp. NPDC091278 TaxID=3155301 RepID=UPI00344EBD9B